MAGTMWTESPIVNEWMDQAVLKERCEMLVQLVQIRFPGALTSDVEKLINQYLSLPLKEDWFRALVTAASFDDFVAVLRR